MYSFDRENHIHTLDGRPLLGTSTVMDVLSKPLTWWASGLAVGKLGWKNPKNFSPEECLESAANALMSIKDMSAEEYNKTLNSAYRAHKDYLDKSADKGTDLHADLEKYVKACLGVGGIPIAKWEDPKISVFVEWSVANVSKFLYSEVHCYDEDLWVGGISDCGAELKTGEIAIIDFKSSREAYNSQYFQIGGYDIELSANGGYTAEGEPVFKLPGEITRHIIVPFGSTNLLHQLEDIEIKKEQRMVARHRDAFRAAVELHKIIRAMEG